MQIRKLREADFTTTIRCGRVSRRDNEDVKTGFSLIAILFVSLAVAAQNAAVQMHTRVLMGDSAHCDSIVIRGGHIVLENVCVKRPGTTSLEGGKVAWDGHTATITEGDEKASASWQASHSLLSRLSTKDRDLYWDGKRVDLGRVDVAALYEAIPYENGILVYARTFPRRHFWESWPFKGQFIEPRDLDPFCAIFFDPRTMKGEDLWINGKAYRGLFVFPIPRE